MISIKDNIIKMKNMSELTLDLAYSAAFLKDIKLAKQVEELNNEIKKIEKDVLKLLFKIKENDEKRLLIIELIDSIKDISNSALNISKIARGNNYPEIIKNILSETQERIITCEIKKNSHLINKSLNETKFRTFTKTQILAIKRKNEWIFNVNKNTILKENDFLIGKGYEGSSKLVKDFVKQKENKLIV